MKWKAVAGCLVMIAALAGTGTAQSLTLDHVDGLYAPDTIPVGQQVTFYLRMTGDDANHGGVTNGFRIYSPDGATWGATVADTLPLNWLQWFGLIFSVNEFSFDGAGADTVGFGGSYNPLNSPGLPAGFDSVSYTITIGPIDPQYHGKTIILDSSYYPPIGTWKWAGPDAFPSWDGPHVYKIFDPNAPTPATLSLSQDTLHFTASELGPNPGQQVLTVSTVEGDNIQFTVAESSPWLTLSYGTLTTPAPVNVSVDFTGLAPGAYFDSIEVASADAQNSPIYAYVEFVVTQAPRHLVNDPTVLNYSAVAGHANPSPSLVFVTEENGLSATWQATHSYSWVHLTDSTGVTPGSFTVQADVSGLIAGTYQDTVVMHWQPDPMDGSSAWTVINLTVTPNHTPQIFEIGNFSITECDTINAIFQASDVESDPIQLWVEPLSDNMQFADHGDGTGTFVFAPSLSQAGDYNLTVYATDGIDTSSQAFSIHVDECQPTHITTDPTELNYSVIFGHADPSPDNVTVVEVGGFAVDWEAAHAESWVHLSDSTGTTPGSFGVHVVTAGLSPGNYSDTVRVAWQPQPSGGDTAITVINLTILPNHAPQLSGLVSFSITECDSIDAIYQATDVDGDPIQLWVEPLVANMQFVDQGNGTGNFTFTPDLTQAGDYSLTANATDGVDTVSLPISIHVDDCQPNVEASAVFDPALLLAVYAYPVHPFVGTVRFGNFSADHTVDDVDLASVRIFGDRVPDMVTVEPSYPGFYGKVIACTYDVSTLVRELLPFYDTTYLAANVNGQFTDAQPFEIVDSLMMIGRRSGDFNLDGSVDVTDIIMFVEYIFVGGPSPADLGVVDMNKDGFVDISDLITLVEMNFK